MSKVNKFMTGSKLAKKHTLSDQKLAESFGACKINFFCKKDGKLSKKYSDVQIKT